MHLKSINIDEKRIYDDSQSLATKQRKSFIITLYKSVATIILFCLNVMLIVPIATRII